MESTQTSNNTNVQSTSSSYTRSEIEDYLKKCLFAQSISKITNIRPQSNPSSKIDINKILHIQRSVHSWNGEIQRHNFLSVKAYGVIHNGDHIVRHSGRQCRHGIVVSNNKVIEFYKNSVKFWKIQDFLNGCSTYYIVKYSKDEDGDDYTTMIARQFIYNPKNIDNFEANVVNSRSFAIICKMGAYNSTTQAILDSIEYEVRDSPSCCTIS